MLGRWHFFCGILLIYVLLLSGIIYDAVTATPLLGRSFDFKSKRQSTVLFLRNRINSQYSLEGFLGGGLFIAGGKLTPKISYLEISFHQNLVLMKQGFAGLGIILLNKSTESSLHKATRLFCLFGYAMALLWKVDFASLLFIYVVLKPGVFQRDGHGLLGIRALRSFP